MSFGKTIPGWIWPGERRKSKRREGLALMAYYWEAAAPHPHAVKDISPSGMYVLTDDRWYANTLVTITLARTDLAKQANRSVRVVGRVVRSGDDGVALTFVWPGRVEEAEAGLAGYKSVKDFVETVGPGYVSNIACHADQVVRSCHPPLLLQASPSRTL